MATDDSREIEQLRARIRNSWSAAERRRRVHQARRIQRALMILAGLRGAL